MMTPTKVGQIVKFRTPLLGEDAKQKYVVLEIHLETDRPRAQIQPLHTGLPFPGINVVSVKDLEIVHPDLSELVGHTVNVKTSENKLVEGTVIRVHEIQQDVDMQKKAVGVETNIAVTVKCADEVEYTGTLFVN